MTQDRIDPAKVALTLARANLSSFIPLAFRILNPNTPYLHSPHIDAIAWHLEQIRLGKIKRLIICMPPRSLKSISASVAFPAFVHGHNPGAHIMAVSYAQDLATKLHNDYRAVLASALYRALFPSTRINPRKDSENEVVLEGRGSRYATSVGGVLTGRGADIVIIDDPLKPDDAKSEAKRTAANNWFGSTLLSRLNHKKHSAIVIVTQRVHIDDLVGHVLETSGDDWTVLELPAIATFEQKIRLSDYRFYLRAPGDVLHLDREDRIVLDQIRLEMGSSAFEAQYQQCPIPPDGAMFKRQWIKRYDMVPAREEEDVIIQSWDTASKDGPDNDWSVGTTWLIRRHHYYLIHLIREKVDYPTLRALAIEAARRYCPDAVLIEDIGIGSGLLTELTNEGIDAIGCRPEVGKVARAANQTPKFESGRVLFPQSAPWLSVAETELFAFPHFRHDDIVDSITQALAYEIPEPPVMYSLRWGADGKQTWTEIK